MSVNKKLQLVHEQNLIKTPNQLGNQRYMTHITLPIFSYAHQSNITVNYA
jgi:hypothetical protein